MGIKEKNFETEVRDFIKKIPNSFLLPKMTHPNIHLPDILFTINGRLFAIELKIKKGYTKREKHQINLLEQMEEKSIVSTLMTPDLFEDWRKSFKEEEVKENGSQKH